MTAWILVDRRTGRPLPWQFATRGEAEAHAEIVGRQCTVESADCICHWLAAYPEPTLGEVS